MAPSATTNSNYCSTTYYKAFTDYFDEVSEAYSWATCQYSNLDFSGAECSSYYTFYYSKCSGYPYNGVSMTDYSGATVSVSGFSMTETTAGTTATDYFTCEQAWAVSPFNGVAPTLPSYGSTATGSATTLWNDLISKYTLSNWYPYLYCSKDNSSPS